MKRFGGLQSLRGIAALLVVLQHVTFYACSINGIDYQPFLRIDFGRIGVQLFFVISGFVMAGCLSQGKRFLLNRMMRIYPGYWLSLAISAVLLSAPIYNWHLTVESVALLPGPLNNSYRVPYWTLVYEMAFYVATYLVVLSGVPRATITKLCIGWLLAIVVANKYLAINGFEPGAFILLAGLNVYFIAGLLIGLHMTDVVRANSTLLALATIALWCAGDSIETTAPLPSNFLLAASFSAIVILGIRHLNSTVLERVGNASFGIYLLHVPITVLVLVELKEKTNTSAFVAWVIALLAALVGSFAFGVFETAMHERIKKIIRARRPIAPATISTTRIDKCG